MAVSLRLALELEHAQFVSLFLTTFLYGFYLSLFMVTTAVVYYNASESTRQQRMKVLPVSFAMFLLSTLFVVVVWIRPLYGFVDRRGESNGVLYEDVSLPSIVVKLACLCVLSLTGDGIIIWRMYVLYKKRFVVVAPAILLVIAYTGVACVVLDLMANLRTGADMLKALEAWISAYFLLMMVTNVFCSGAITLRIFVTRSPLRNMSILWLTALLIVESSTMYALSVIAGLATFLGSYDGQYPEMDAIVLLVGALIVPQIRFHITTMTDPQGDGQLSNAAWLGHRAYPAIDEDPEYPLLQTRTTVSVPKHTHTNPHEPISETDGLTTLWLI